MPRLIDANALYDKVLMANCGMTDCGKESCNRCCIKPALKFIEDAPTVDIVHCKECKHWHKGLCRKNPIARVTVEYDFCSEGEKDE